MLLGEGPAGGGHPHAGCPEPLEGETDLSGHERFGYVVTSAGLVLFAVRGPPRPAPAPRRGRGAFAAGPPGGEGGGCRGAAGRRGGPPAGSRPRKCQVPGSGLQPAPRAPPGPSAS